MIIKSEERRRTAIRRILADALGALALGVVLSLAWPSAHAAAASNILTWDYLATDVTTYGVTGFTVERKTEDCSVTGSPIVFTEVAAVASSVRTYTDSAVIGGVNYCYRVASVNPTGKAYSNLAGRVVPLAAPPAPSLRPVVGGI